jgi:hypothetical protein
MNLEILHRFTETADGHCCDDPRCEQCIIVLRVGEAVPRLVALDKLVRAVLEDAETEKGCSQGVLWLWWW